LELEEWEICQANMVLLFIKIIIKKRVEEKGERGVMEKGKKLRGRAGYGVEFSVRPSG
jgi:hypothetical protein